MRLKPVTSGAAVVLMFCIACAADSPASAPPPADPATAVEVTGSARVKVGDTYAYSATARLADGSVVSRPVTWSVSDTATGSISSQGLLVPTKSGPLTVTAGVDAATGKDVVAAYDWEDASSNGSLRLSLSSDTPIPNSQNESFYPYIVISCTASGYLWIWIGIDGVVATDKPVTYNFDSGQVFSASWELPPPDNSLWQPGPTNHDTKMFATSLAAARTFTFAFTQLGGAARVVQFRVTGLTSRLTPLLNACPDDGLTNAGLRADIIMASEHAVARNAKALRLP